MRRLFITTTLVLILGAAVCSAAPQTQLLPNRIVKWTAASGASQSSVNLPPPVSSETSGTAESRTYSSGNAETLTIQLQKYADPSAAYEAYTAQLEMGLNPGDLKVPSAVDTKETKMLILIGNFVVDQIGRASCRERV